MTTEETKIACSIRVRGVVQGVGFRPFVFRLAARHGLAGWVQNGNEGVEIHLEGTEEMLADFVRDLRADAPPASRVAHVDVGPATPSGCTDFVIRESSDGDRPTARISPDLPVCEACLRELFDPGDSRYRYPYINCTNCGPRYSVIEALPYDRPRTTMKHWALDPYCAGEYQDPCSRRFHAQPVACRVCGPRYHLQGDNETRFDNEAIRRTADLLRSGRIVAIKGLGGYHLACDASSAEAVRALRERKYRKEKPFALMVKNLGAARRFAEVSSQAEQLLTSPARPIVLLPARVELPGVAPANHDFGIMLPYTPLHHLLFDAGAPDALVMTSANRSSEPIAYQDEDARARLAGIADAFLMGERPIARRVDDSVASTGEFGPVILRRARGYAPGAVAALPAARPLLALGADLKNAITLVIDGQAFVSQHIGDLDQFLAFQAFRETISDLVSMYEAKWEELDVAHDAHPQYVSTAYARELAAVRKYPVQHHEAHIASVVAERNAWEKQVVGVAFDGTGYGDDGSIWGGEIFVGSVAQGFERVAHLRAASLPGGDAAAQHPVQAAAGYLEQITGLPDLTAPPFRFPPRYGHSLQLLQKGVRSFRTTSVGRLFDTAAALLGFTREVTFEGQAAMWLEHLARGAPAVTPYAFPLSGCELDFCPLLSSMIFDRLAGRDRAEIARAFHAGVAQGLFQAVQAIAQSCGIDVLVVSGGVFQNRLLLEELSALVRRDRLELWTNRAVPPNDGGISLGQAALAAFAGRNRAS